MRRILKRIINFTREILNALWSVALVVFFSDWHPQLNHLERTKEECFVLGNGPSLRTLLETRPEVLNGRSIVCMNDFLDSPWFTKLQPSYYVATDPVYWSTSTSDRLTQKYKQYAELLTNTVTWPLTIFLPVAAKHGNVFWDIPERNGNISICYVNTTQLTAPHWLLHYFWRRNLAMPTMQTILVAAIFLSVNLRFSSIYVAGADNSWHEDIYVDNDNVLRVRYERFHESTPQQATPFTQDSAEREPYNVPSFFGWLAQIFLGYHEIFEYTKSTHTRIINVSPKSYIDAFVRMKLSDIPLAIRGKE